MTPQNILARYPSDNISFLGRAALRRNPSSLSICVQQEMRPRATAATPHAFRTLSACGTDWKCFIRAYLQTAFSFWFVFSWISTPNLCHQLVWHSCFLSVICNPGPDERQNIRSFSCQGSAPRRAETVVWFSEIRYYSIKQNPDETQSNNKLMDRFLSLQKCVCSFPHSELVWLQFLFGGVGTTISACLFSWTSPVSAPASPLSLLLVSSYSFFALWETGSLVLSGCNTGTRSRASVQKCSGEFSSHDPHVEFQRGRHT